VSRNKKYVEKAVFPIHVIVQERDEGTDRILEGYKWCIEEVRHLENNIGCGPGCSLGLEWGLEFDPDYILYLEDDWFSVESLSYYIREIIKYMDEHEDVGYIRLRSYSEPVSKKNRISGEIVYYQRATKNILVGNPNFTSNPILMKASVARDFVPITSVLDGMRKYAQLGLRACQLKGRCFYHIGFQRAKAYNQEDIKWVK
jgi:hypothetical protein